MNSLEESFILWTSMCLKMRLFVFGTDFLKIVEDKITLVFKLDHLILTKDLEQLKTILDCDKIEIEEICGYCIKLSFINPKLDKIINFKNSFNKLLT